MGMASGSDSLSSLETSRPGQVLDDPSHQGVHASEEREQFLQLLGWAKSNLTGRLSVEQLATKAAMSPRQLGRVFSKQIKLTPSRFLEMLRVHAAMSRLEESHDSAGMIARKCGFGSRASLYRSFMRLLHMTPQEYRQRMTRSAGTIVDPTILSFPKLMSSIAAEAAPKEEPDAGLSGKPWGDSSCND